MVNLKMRSQRYRQWTAPQQKEAIRLYLEEKMTTAQVAERMGRTQSSIRGLLYACGVAREIRRDNAGKLQGQTWEEWRKEKHNGNLPVTAVPCPEYRPDLPAKAFEEDEPIGGKR